MFLAYFLRTSRIMTNPMTMIAIMIAATEGKKYCSTMVGGACVGAAVCSGASSTANAVVACDGQYDSEPMNVA